MTHDKNKTERTPVVAIMGHIDHGKSTLLSYIRKAKEPLNEAGGITQHISAYEVEHESPEGKKKKITFIDTPGHAAFFGIRKRGASVADVVILVVSAEDGVKPQTKEALASILESKTPYIIAINKIDRPEADVEKTKQSLAENEIYIEGYGGDVPFVPISSKTGEGVPELLDMIILIAELEDLKGDPSLPAEGMVIESNRDIKKGISATCIIKNGTLEKGMFIASGVASSPVRIMENYLGKQLAKASFSSPVKIIGWDELPLVGDSFKSFKNRDEVREFVAENKAKQGKSNDLDVSVDDESLSFVPLIIKADTGNSLEALVSEVKKLATDRIVPKIISCGIGTISENDIKLANGTEKAIVIGFNTKIDAPAKHLAERNEIEVKTFDIIYKMNEWLEELLKKRTPKMKMEESEGVAKVLKVFSKMKDRQILGGKVEKGSIKLGSTVKILRRDEKIGEGKVNELQQQKSKSSEITEGNEFGAMIVSGTLIEAGDRIEGFIVVEK